jgi:hypothetical protein
MNVIRKEIKDIRKSKELLERKSIAFEMENITGRD